MNEFRAIRWRLRTVAALALFKAAGDDRMTRSRWPSIKAVVGTVARAAHLLTRWAEYRGRDDRRAFGTFLLMIAAAVSFGRLMDLFLFSSVPGGVPIFFMAFAGLIPIPALAAIGFRRLPVTGRSGWRLLLLMVSFVGWVALTFWWCLPTCEPASRGAAGAE